MVYVFDNHDGGEETCASCEGSGRVCPSLNRPLEDIILDAGEIRGICYRAWEWLSLHDFRIQDEAKSEEELDESSACRPIHQTRCKNPECEGRCSPARDLRARQMVAGLGNGRRG